jgi:hypothetical protein
MSELKEGSVVMIFANPVKTEHPIDQARLIKPIYKFTSMEYWMIEYTNDLDHFYKAWVKNGKNK